jgi:hypothetical protein
MCSPNIKVVDLLPVGIVAMSTYPCSFEISFF